MDGLDLLKKDWDKESSKKKLSVKDIYPMLHKKSSSIVKILFYISLAELVFWILVNSLPYFTSDSYNERLDLVFQNDYILTGLTITSYAIILLFVYLLYKSYKSISITDSAKNLMESILKTRKIIKYYVLYNLIAAGLSLIIGFYYALHNTPNTAIDFSNISGKKMALIITSFSNVFYFANFAVLIFNNLLLLKMFNSEL